MRRRHGRSCRWRRASGSDKLDFESNRRAADGGRLDVHHHYLSPGWKTALINQNIVGTIAYMNWSVAGSIASIDAGGVTTSTREMNDFRAELVRDHKPATVSSPCCRCRTPKRPDAVVVIGYDKEKGDFYPASQPGGIPLKR